MVGWNRTVGGCVRVEKRGGETKILKREQAGSRDECLKKGGGWNPLTNYTSGG